MDVGNFTEDEKVRCFRRKASPSPGLSVDLSDMLLQRFVLAEYIKASQVDTDQLVAFIKQCKLQPDWFMMQLPGG